MVALATPKFDSVLPLNLARPMLLAAQECEERGDLIGCGVRLREALRRQLHAMCLFGACLPTSRRPPTPSALLDALRKAGECDHSGYKVVQEMIVLGNAAAHCGRVDRDSLRGAMTMLHWIIDENPCGETFERFHQPAGCGDCFEAWDDDDDDVAEAWKGGGQ